MKTDFVTFQKLNRFLSLRTIDPFTPFSHTTTPSPFNLFPWGVPYMITLYFRESLEWSKRGISEFSKG